jgi:hypothetical protein
VTRLWFFLWWWQIVAGVFGAILMLPLNSMLGIMGISLSPQIAVVAAVLVIGPILLKMLIGHPFNGFRLEARRSAKA